MARPLRLHFPGALCHVLCRGNAKQTIFADDTDYRRYIELLEGAAQRFHVQCGVFCLVVNHVHLVVRPQEFPVSRMMQQLNSAYCGWWNRRHGRVGHVLQGRFKLLIVGDELYRHRLVRYVLRNPLAAGLVRRLEDWPWSSYRASAGFEPVPAFLNCDEVWSLFPPGGPLPATQQLRMFLESAEDDVLDSPGLIEGTRTFTAMIEPYLRQHATNSEFVYAHRFAARPSLAELFEGACVPLAVSARLAFQDYGYSLGELSAYLGRTPSTIWRWVRHGVRSRSSR